MKKLISMLLTMALAITCFTALIGCGGDKDYSKAVAFITEVTSGANDNGYNQFGAEGLKAAEKKHGITTKVVEKPASAATAMEECAELGYGLVFSLQYDFTALIQGEGSKKSIAERYPDTTFVVFNDTPNVSKDGARIHDNVICVTFDVHEASFLAGALAVTLIENQDMLKGGSYTMVAPDDGGRAVAFMGATESNGIMVFGHGFYEGVNYAAAEQGADVKYSVYESTTVGFEDTASAKTSAKTFFDQKVNLIYTAAGVAGKGVTGAAQEAKRFAIEVDANKDKAAPGYVATSVLKNTSVPVQAIVQAFVDGKLKDIADAKGVVSYDLASGATGITDMAELAKNINTDETSQGKWTDIKAYLEELKGKIGDGTIDVTNAQAGEVIDKAGLTNLLFK